MAAPTEFIVLSEKEILKGLAQKGDIDAIRLLDEHSRWAQLDELIKEKFGVTPDKKE
jgi:hypothetical protein